MSEMLSRYHYFVLCLGALMVLLAPAAQGACAITNGDGTCSSCVDPTSQYGSYCQACPCKRGVCNAGVTGNGMCSSCNALSFGPYCDRALQPSAQLLDWTQITCCSVSFAMVTMVVWSYLFTLMPRVKQTAAAAAEGNVEENATHTAPSVTSVEDYDEPEIQFFPATDLRGGREADEPPKKQLKRPATRPVVTQPTSEPVPARLFESQSRSPTRQVETVNVTRYPQPAPSVSSRARSDGPSVSLGAGPRRAASASSVSTSRHSPFPEGNRRDSLPTSTAQKQSQAPAALPRFRPGDKIRRNAKNDVESCDFGGFVGEVLCGECVVVDTIVVHRTPSKGATFGFTVLGGDREASATNVEDLFDVVTSSSEYASSNENEEDETSSSDSSSDKDHREYS